MPKQVVSDRDLLFTSNLWEQLHQLIGMTLHHPTACVPPHDWTVTVFAALAMLM
ncbi:hypothetical protein M422DRAFT_274037 [Sphaerobolus stellatus SS14]|uniref:Integrase catalytic domain-containing protein n=1 Tax=Sphaerobolus stellatus (strain SS14) TaxID=990650 RepID=A0A0C9UI32_SPHS4|nr:hypothetical protein M422DRAFT_274037 [Sphaerobolus stellatus SS14]